MFLFFTWSTTSSLINRIKVVEELIIFFFNTRIKNETLPSVIITMLPFTRSVFFIGLHAVSGSASTSLPDILKVLGYKFNLLSISPVNSVPTTLSGPDRIFNRLIIEKRTFGL